MGLIEVFSPSSLTILSLQLNNLCTQFSSVEFSYSVVSDSLQPHELVGLKSLRIFFWCFTLIFWQYFKII